MIKEEDRIYHRDWKRRKRAELGTLPRGKHVRKPRTKEEKEQSKKGRSKWESKWRLEYFEIKPQKRLLWAARKRAKERNIEFSLVEDDIVVPTHCPILGIPLVNSRRRGDTRRDIASLDRVDSSKGYTKDNIEVISWQANTMKNNATPDLLIAFAREILKRYDTSDLRL